jgi:hypothetical protein
MRDSYVTSDDHCLNIGAFLTCECDLVECNTVYISNRDGNRALRCGKKRRDVDLRKFPPVGLCYVCVLVALA